MAISQATHTRRLNRRDGLLPLRRGRALIRARRLQGVFQGVLETRLTTRKAPKTLGVLFCFTDKHVLDFDLPHQLWADYGFQLSKDYNIFKFHEWYLNISKYWIDSHIFAGWEDSPELQGGNGGKPGAKGHKTSVFFYFCLAIFGIKPSHFWVLNILIHSHVGRGQDRGERTNKIRTSW